MVVGFQCKDVRCWFAQDFLDEDVPRICPVCNNKNYRLIYRKEPKKKSQLINIDGTSRGNPRLSWSMGVNRADIPAMMKKFPDRTYHPVTGQLLVESRQHKKRLMREHGFEELS